MINTVTLVGRVVKDVEVQTTQSGTSIASLTLAVTRNFKNASGEYESDFIRCKAFGNTATHLGQYTSKGKVLSLVGSIQTGSYDKEDGTKVFTTDVIINNCDCFTGNTKDQAQQPLNDFNQVSTITDADLPF